MGMPSSALVLANTKWLAPSSRPAWRKRSYIQCGGQRGLDNDFILSDGKVRRHAVIANQGTTFVITDFRIRQRSSGAG